MVFALLVTSLVLLILAGVGIPTKRFNLGWFGLAFYVLSLMLSGGLLD